MNQPQASRPSMKNYGIASDNDGLMEWSWVDDQMTRARNYWIATVRPDGKPHVAPVWGVWLEGALYFGSDRGSRKVRNIAHQPAVSVHLESGDETVILEGVVDEVSDHAILTRIASLYGKKYPPHTPDPDTDFTFCFRFTPQMGLSWLEQDFPRTATRWTF